MTADSPQQPSDPPEDASPTDSPAEPADAAQDGSDGSDDQDDRPAAEAARYRRRLRETETERDQLVSLVDGFRRREAERIAAASLSKPSDLWLDGRDLADLLDKDGMVDTEKVNAEVSSVLDGRPLLAATRPRPKPDDAQGQPRPPRSPESGWPDVLRGRRAGGDPNMAMHVGPEARAAAGRSSSKPFAEAGG